jgi:surface polysaccharide O-acyltransferase-like enzyme
MTAPLISKPMPSIFYIDLLRCIAAFAVVAIHVLGPLRELFGEVATVEWLAAMGINSSTRWAVPIFMMISGALLISTQKPFVCSEYLPKRLMKVVIPFIAWTLIYAMVGGFSADSWQWTETVKILQESPNQPVWYHLWFFYDFIPLYFVIPFLQPLVKNTEPERMKLLIVSWGFLTLMYFFKVETFLKESLILYTGYLLLGWYLFNRDNRPQLKLWLIAGISALVINFFGSWLLAHLNGKYSSFFMGYKSINTVLIGGMLFVVAQAYADSIKESLKPLIKTISKYSLGIYLLHPLLLIPVRELNNGVYDWFFSYWLAIPIITILTLIVSLVLVIALAKIPLVNRLVP